MMTWWFSELLIKTILDTGKPVGVSLLQSDRRPVVRSPATVVLEDLSTVTAWLPVFKLTDRLRSY